ncbi:MAG: response regulator, partial [Planctomycetes bacterium]|nr:response regulator [Planctomycetota bacterium]
KALLEEIRTSMAIRAEGKGIDCKLVIANDVPELISSDPMRLRQILLNLVGNAVKFTNHGSVTLDASARAVDAKDASRIDLVLRVSDTGCGMEEDQLAKVFQPFTQADTSTTREYGGSGLGLTICRRLVELLGGRVEAYSQVGSGSEFVVTLPITRAAPTSPPRIDDGRRLTELAANSDHRGLEGLEFLLAEDGEDNRRLLSHFLRRAGAVVTLAHDGQEAYDRILEQGETYDLIIMDMQMPRMDGYVATSSLRAAGVTTPILALTAHAMRGDAERCLAAGCDAYATKPIGAKKLTALCHGLWLQHGADQASIKNRVS